MDSYHAEAYRLLCITTLVTLLMQYTANTFAPIELLCDSDALVKKVKKLRKSTRLEFPNETLAGMSFSASLRISKSSQKNPASGGSQATKMTKLP
jgi:hypothetical protein